MPQLDRLSSFVGPARNRVDAAPELHLGWAYCFIVLGKFGTAGHFVFTRSLVHFWMPQVLSPLRMLLSVPIMWAVALALEGPPDLSLAKRHWRLLAACGALGIFAAQLLATWGLVFAPAPNHAVLMQAVPAFTVLLAVCLRTEPLSCPKLGGSALAILGAAVMLRPWERCTLDGVGVAAGNAMFLADSACNAILLTAKRELMARGLPPFTVSALAESTAASLGLLTLGGGLLYAPLASAQAVRLAGAGWAVLFAPLILAVVTSLDSLLVAAAMKRLSAVVTSIGNALVPPFTAALSLVALHESLKQNDVLGGGVIAAGVAAVVWAREREERAASAVALARESTGRCPEAGSTADDALSRPLLWDAAELDANGGPAAGFASPGIALGRN